MSRTCVACKKPIPATESAWRDMRKTYCCKRCYRPGVSVARAVKSDG